MSKGAGNLNLAQVGDISWNACDAADYFVQDPPQYSFVEKQLKLSKLPSLCCRTCFLLGNFLPLPRIPRSWCSGLCLQANPDCSPSRKIRRLQSLLCSSPVSRRSNPALSRLFPSAVSRQGHVDSCSCHSSSFSPDFAAWEFCEAANLFLVAATLHWFGCNMQSASEDLIGSALSDTVCCKLGMNLSGSSASTIVAVVARKNEVLHTVIKGYSVFVACAQICFLICFASHFCLAYTWWSGLHFLLQVNLGIYRCGLYLHLNSIMVGVIGVTCSQAKVPMMQPNVLRLSNTRTLLCAIATHNYRNIPILCLIRQAQFKAIQIYISYTWVTGKYSQPLLEITNDSTHSCACPLAHRINYLPQIQSRST